MKTRILLALAALSIGAAGAIAQGPADGDLVLSSIGTNQGLFYVKNTSRAPTAFQQHPALAAVMTRWANLGAVAAAHGAGSTLINVYQTGTNPISSLPSAARASGMALDQDASTVITSSTGDIFRLSGTTVSTWRVLSGTINAIDRDGDTGDFVVARFTDGWVMRIDRATKQITTIATARVLGGNSVAGISYQSQTGYYGIARLNSPDGFVLLSRGGRVLATAPISGANAITANGPDGLFHVATAAGDVHELSGQGAVTRTQSFSGSYLFSGVDIWNDRVISLQGSGAPGTTMNVTLRFTRSTSRPYWMAMSLARRPGIPFGSQTLNLAPDALFALTAGRNIRGLTSGFFGTTSAGTGYAAAAITIPSNAPVGFAIQVGAIASSRAFPGGFEVAPTEVFKITATRR